MLADSKTFASPLLGLWVQGVRVWALGFGTKDDKAVSCGGTQPRYLNADAECVISCPEGSAKPQTLNPTP